jgi:magnesium-transporting ATPase (P-type)
MRRYGPNRIERVKRKGLLAILFRQLTSPLVYVLIAAALLALLMGKVTDGFVVLAVVVVNTLVGFVQEIRASNAIEALIRMVPEYATVVRDGDQDQVAAHEVVPGDVVLLQPGDKVPADLRLFEVSNLHVDEAALTGESLPVPKREALVAQDAPVSDRESIAFGGTLVTSGTAAGVVVATGNDTELGRISQLLRETAEIETPMTRRLAKLATTITLCILVITVLIFVIGIFRAYPLLDSALAAITLAVAAIPEGLPAVITIASAVGLRRMARRHVIIRHLPAVETLGSVTVICTDKTGTLTRNEMTVEALWTHEGQYEMTGVGYAPEGALFSGTTRLERVPDNVHHLLRTSVLCNDASLDRENGRWTIVGDPTEAALLVAARKAGLDEEALRDAEPRQDEIPFDSGRQFMATLHRAEGEGSFVCVKGAPEVVVGLCQTLADGTTLDHKRVHHAVNELTARGMRVLAIASGLAPASMAEFRRMAPGVPLRLLGLVGMIDPPRPEAIESVRRCQEAGITIKMITGDHPGTARAIGEALGLLNGHDHQRGIVTGKELASATDKELEELVHDSNVFARVAPEHKLRLVRALQSRGDIVAMTGDGVNDAPALKRANIGVAMGIGGTAVARETADMVLADDNFASIAAAVEEGRRVYDNLMKSLVFILPTSLGQAMIIIVAVLFFPIAGDRLLMPIEPVQILWVNLVVAVTLALPLAFEAKEPGLMSRPPRPPQTPLLSGFLVTRTVLVAALMTASAVALFLYEYTGDLRLGIDPVIALAESQTVAVTTIILFQAVYLLNCRSLTASVFNIGLFTNRYVYVGIAIALVLLVCFVYLAPLNRLFHTHPLSVTDWIAPIAVALAALPIVNLEKRLWQWRNERAQSNKGKNI